MKRPPTTFRCLLAVMVLGAVSSSHADDFNHALHGYTIAGARSNQILRGGLIQTHKAPVDSFYLYGGPGTTEGKFETSSGAPDMQEWLGVDLTERTPFWQLSAFNSPTGTQAAWCGRSAEEEPGWVTAPGYGNNWNDHLVLTVPVNDPNQPTNLTWTFTYNYDLEPIYDFFAAAWDSATSSYYKTIPLLLQDHTNKDSLGVFTPVAQQLTQLIQPGQYTGENSDEIQLRFRVTSDGGWSDEDGLWPTVGAVQMDDVTVDLGPQGGPYVADFENGFAPWQPEPSDFVGDFAKVFGDILEIDPCRDNRTPQLNFIDDGTPPSNGDGRSTGGTRPMNNWWGCCFPDFIVNYTGGLRHDGKGLDNRAWSPPIDYDLPGPSDDGADGVLILAFDRNALLPLGNGMFYVWHVRSTEDPSGAAGWTEWQDNGMIYYEWLELGRTTVNVADKIPNLTRVQKVQISLGIRDLANIFAFPGNDATVSPTFDNVSLRKAAAPGPLLQTRAIDLLQGGFSQGGAAATEYDGPVGPNDETIFATRIDRAGAINEGGVTAVAGDSLTVSARAVVPGTALLEPPRLKYRLFANPAFDHVRETSMHTPAGSVASGPGGDWNVWDGTVEGDSARTDSGEALADVFAFDPPFDGPTPRGGGLITDDPEPAAFYPGDWFFYYVEAADDAGNTITIPAGPGQGLAPAQWPVLASEGGTVADYAELARTFYDPHWRIRALPTIGAAVRTLFINDAFGTGNEALWRTAFLENGMLEGIDVDSYRVFAPDVHGADNGIGSAGVHGASAEQLQEYEVLLYDGGSLSSLLLSDGSDATLSVDRSDDQGVLTAWHNQPGNRAAIHWGDNLASYLNTNGPGYLQQVLGVELGPRYSNLGPRLSSRSPDVISLQGGISFQLLGGCPDFNQIDDIWPRSEVGALATHLYVDAGAVLPDAFASVTFDRVVEGFRKVDVTFPFAFALVGSFSNDNVSDGRTARSVLLEEVLTRVGASTPGPTSAPERSSPLQLEANWPNPFNPRTTIRFSVPRTQRAQLRVLDTRGRVLRVLIDDVLDPGDHRVVFDGRDDAGGKLASGVYLYELVIDHERRVRKLALLR